MTISFRDAVPGDENEVGRFVRALADFEKLAHEAVATDEDFRRALFGTPPRARALFAIRNGETAGFAVWYYTFSTFSGRCGLFVEDVFVPSAHRKQGVGRAIFAELARRAVADNCDAMEWSVLDWNTPAVTFYKSIGARPKDGWTEQRLTGAALQALAVA